MSFLDLSDVKEPKELEPGEYEVLSESVELKDTKAGNGQYLNFKFKVEMNDGFNHYIYEMFNIRNQNDTAQQIGRRQLKEFLKAAKYPTPDNVSDINDLMGLKAKAVIAYKHDSFAGKMRPYIKRFKALEDNITL